MFILKNLKEKGFFCKMAKRGRDSLRNRERGRGLRAKWPLFPPSSRRRAGEGRLGRRRRPSPAAQGTAATGIRGEREREACGVDSPLDFREGPREEGSHGGGRRAVLAGAAAAL